MKFAITATDHDDYYQIRNFETVDDLIRFMKKEKHPLIIDSNFLYGETNINFIAEYNPHVDAAELVKVPYQIEIYNDYRE